MIFIFLKALILFPYLFIKKVIEDRKRGIHLYGIYGFFGLPGKGKTMAMSKKLKEYRKKYGNDIYIMTNYFFEDQDFEFTSWKDLLKEYDKPLICAWDEVQNTFKAINNARQPTPQSRRISIVPTTL